MTDRDERRDGATRASSAIAGPSRRALLLGAGAAGVAGALVACGDEPGSRGSAGATSPPPATGSTFTTADVPVNGGTVFKDQRIVVTQPAAGMFKAFDATCTHLGCLVSSVHDGKINCACHGSQYTIADGSVARGPATVGLAAKTVTVSGDTLTVT